MLNNNLAGKLIVSIADVCKNEVALVGGKGANLGELVGVGIPVPPGFVVTVPAYFSFIERAGIGRELELLVGGLDIADSASLESVSSEMNALISGAQMPADLASEITSAYQGIGCSLVAVRSSATAEDLAEASFAGQQETFLNIEGEADVLRAVQNCWASLFSAHAVSYRERAGIRQLDVGMAVVVQHMVQSERSGVVFTMDPVTGDHGRIMIEAVFGLGEGLVSGTLTPDMYVVDKASGQVLDSQVVLQEKELVRHLDATSGVHCNGWVAVDWARRGKQKLTDEEAGELAALGSRLEQHFGCPQDIEWAYEDGCFYLVQARAVTTIAAAENS